MSDYSLTHLTNPGLLLHVTDVVSRDRATTAELLAGLAEVDARKLYVGAAYSSMSAWCVGVLKLSEDSVAKRIQAARAARRFPALFPMLADGRLSLNSVVLLAPHLTSENVDDLLAAASDQPRSAIERLLAERFPKPDLPMKLTPPGGDEHAARHAVDLHSAAAPVQGNDNQHAARHVPTHSRCTPLSPGRVGLQGTIRQSTHEKLCYAQSLLGAEVPAGDLDPLLDRALDALIPQLEKRRFAATSRPRPSSRCHRDGSRHVPAEVRRMVWQRDGGQCTFVGDKGHRCEERSNLEFDHIDPFARGGSSTPDNLRLRCRAHNQFEAERTFGADFMKHKRDEAKRLTTEAREAKRTAAAQAAEAREAQKRAERERAAAEARTREAEKLAERERQAALQARRDEIIPALRNLGYSLTEARLASTVCDTMPDATLEDWLRAALKRLMPRGVRIERPCARGAA